MNLLCAYFRYRFLAGCIASFILYPATAIAQPGWRDLSRHYDFTITDENGKPVRFSDDPSYKIVIDNKVFSSPHIPKEQLLPVQYLSDTFYNYIRLNDFSYTTILELNETFTVKIVRDEDTMCLSAGQGLVLKFSKGNYYFPSWAGDLLRENGLFNKQAITIVNRDQGLFRVSPKNFQNRPTQQWENHDPQSTPYDEVIQNFIDATLVAKQTVEDIRVTNPMKGYNRAWWEGEPYAAPDSNRFVGMTEYVYEYSQSNHSVYMNVFSIFDKASNTITLWKRSDNPLAFYEGPLSFDRWNKKLYLYVGDRNLENVLNPLDFHQYPFITTIYESSDYGKSWRRSSHFQHLYDQTKTQKIFFLDKEYAVVMKSKEVMTPRNYPIKQGTFLLTRNFKVVDSLVTPDGIHYDYNSCCFKAERINDTLVNLGRLEFDDQDSRRYTQPRLVKKGNQWFFEVVKDSSKKVQEYITISEEYRNFTLSDRREFSFKNGGFFRTDGEIINVLEKKDMICIMHRYFVLLSFNAGRTWHLYPKPLNTRGGYFLPEIKENGEISFYDMRDLKKYVYSFKEK
jgi:hypothetical protein